MKQTVAKLFHSVAGRYGSTVLDHRSTLVIGAQLALILAANWTAFALRFEAIFPLNIGRSCGIIWPPCC